MDMKRFFLYAIVIAALALAGCGSDGNGGMTGTMPPDPPDPPAQMAHDVDLTDLPEITIPADTVINAGESMNFGMGQNQVTISCPSGGGNCELMQTDDGVTSTGGMATAMLSGAAMTARREAAAARVAATTKAAGTKRKVIAAEAGQTSDAGLGGSDHVNADGIADNADDPYDLAISRDHMATKVKITDHGMTGDDDPKFTQTMDLGNGLTMHTRTMEADDDGDVVEEVVMVKTDIEAPKDTAFAKVAGQALNVNPKTSGGADFRSLAIAGSGALDTIDLMKVGGAPSQTGRVSSTTYTDNPATADVNERTFKGTYNGASGTYACTGAGD